MVHVGLQLLEFLLVQLGHVVLQLLHGDQLTVGHHAGVLVQTPKHTRSQPDGGERSLDSRQTWSPWKRGPSHIPDICAGGVANLPDGATLPLVFVPTRCLAGAVTVVSELALGTAVQAHLVAETAVAHLGGQTDT